MLPPSFFVVTIIETCGFFMLIANFTPKDAFVLQLASQKGKAVNMKPKLISFVIPARDEERTVETLYRKISEVLKKININFEVIFIDDGSKDKTFEILHRISVKDNHLKVIQLRGGFGKSIALQTGFNVAKGDVVFTMDADLQDDPTDIPKFLNKLLVSGWKKVRYDPITKTLPSKLGNNLVRFLTHLPIHDSNCGFKAYRKEVLRDINLYGELYKYIPIFAQSNNFTVGEVIISHHARKFGKSKFGMERNIKGILDLITVVFLTGYVKRPGHFFGTVGFSFFSLGFAIGLYIAYLRITTGGIEFHVPLLFLGVLLMVVGIQFFSTGLISELITSYNQDKSKTKSYIRDSR
jgi:glycosyltransferase involved in cell wall biosynthesis